MESDAVLEWSKIASQIELEKRAAKERILKENGISEDGFEDLRDIVLIELEKLDGKVIENEYGEIRGQWSFIKDRDGRVEKLAISRCFIVPKGKK